MTPLHMFPRKFFSTAVTRFFGKHNEYKHIQAQIKISEVYYSAFIFLKKTATIKLPKKLPENILDNINHCFLECV